MTPNQLRDYARQGGLPVIAQLARSALAPILEHTAASWPEPLRQRGVSCQTVAVINGIRCWQAACGSRVWNPSLAEVDAIRREAGTLEGSNAAEMADSVGRLLVRRGLLLAAQPVQQPISAAETMATGGFTVVTSGEAWHATTIVPNLARLATSSEVPEFVSIDSLSGRQLGMGVDEFCTVVLDQQWDRLDETLVCTVAPAALQ